MLSASQLGFEPILNILEDLIALGNATSKPQNQNLVAGETDGKSSTSQVQDQVRVGGAAINRLAKPADRSQEATSEPKFVIRWANAMLSSVFSALTFGLQSRDFINAVK